MLVTLEWLKEYIAFDLNAERTGHLLTMAGLEVESFEESELGAVLNVKVTPNRGDCLSVVGLAREIMAKLGPACQPTDAWAAYRSGWAYGDEGDAGDCAALGSVTIVAPDLCPRYGARLVRGFKVGPSGELMQKRLIACGLRPITNIVDVTNYVLLELGQPLHAFDQSLLHGGKIVIREAGQGEAITTIDGTVCPVAPPMLMICDADHPVAVAGIMGGAESEVAEGTNQLLLESAHFNPVSIRRTSKALGLKTESSYRFERSVDPGGVITALNRACRLIEQETGTAPVKGVIDVYPRGPQPHVIELDMARCDMLLGIEVPMGAAMGYLTRLGLTVEPCEGKLKVTVPERRPDLQRPDDLVEEIGRVHGYEHIADELPRGRTLLGREDPVTEFDELIRERLVRLGLTEVVNHTLTAPSPVDGLAENEYVRPRTPAGPELSVLRPGLLSGVVGSALRNLRRDVTDLALFEIGRAFRKEFEESKRAALLLCGRKAPPDWQVGEKGAAFDFFALKGIVEALLSEAGVEAALEPACDPRLHPGRSACLKGLGVFGELAPELCAKLDLPPRTLVAELSVDAMRAASKREFRYSPPPRFPSVRRDLAFEIAKSVPFAQIESAAREAAGPGLEELRLFDVYEGKGIAEGGHSLAIALTLRKPDGTLTDEEANDVRERVFSALAALGAKRR